MTSTQAIVGFLHSQESLTRLVQGYYQVFLQRLADPTGLNAWVSRLQQGTSFLTIGQGFQLTDPTHAEGGTLYDPKTGKTYRGAMKAEGDELDLRGYVGIKLFGESQTWKRVAHPPAPCSSNGK